MKRTTIALSDELARLLEREVRRRGASMSEVVREALSVYLVAGGGKKRKVPFAALGDSGHTNTARDMEEILEDEWGPDRGR